jgi:hypothetical protein
MPRDPRSSSFFGSHQTSPIMIRQARIGDTALVTSREITEAESKEKHGVARGPHAGADYKTSPYVHSRVDFSTFTMGNPMPESTLTLCQSRLYPPSQGHWIWPLVARTQTLPRWLGGEGVKTTENKIHWPVHKYSSFVHGGKSSPATCECVSNKIC